MPSPLLDVMVERGGVTGDYHGRSLVRHFGDAAAEYTAATEGAAVFDRSHRTRLRVAGKAPLQMLSGVLTGRMPAPATEENGLFRGEATYHAVLTPKGKMVSDLWSSLPRDEADPGVILDVPVAGTDPLLDTFKKVLPPRFAAVADASEEIAMITVVGPSAAGLVADHFLESRVTTEELEGAEEGRWWRIGGDSDAITVTRTAEVWPSAYSLTGAAELVTRAWTELVDAGATPAGLGVWSTLRVEAGRPVFGTDMDDGTIPVEAGIDGRAIDHTKGCYTGQEVIVRIRDRGHVNRHLRLLELGDVPTPAAGTPLFNPEDATKEVGRVTSAVQSPRFGGVAALAYVRREMETVTLDGREVTVPTE